MAIVSRFGGLHQEKSEKVQEGGQKYITINTIKINK